MAQKDDARPLLRSLLVERYNDLKRQLTRRLGNAELAGDALQDTWLRLQAQDDRGGMVARPYSYLLRMAVNIAVDAQRSQTRMLSAEEIEALAELPDPAPGPVQTAEDRAQVEALLKAVQRMPERCRQVLVLVRWEGLPQVEVARRLGISVRAVEYELKKAQDLCMARIGREKR
ncbi:RNA polymerase subunit sigma-70 [Pigmentiphaga sp. NML080357]|uniref:RNA polymerase sigma factor n=1 Tax=Pigmentiphaga sp. NML080357 TaxID=2008675 RepID=UPI000B4193BD|nr:sigma-70 family RNA polymerase sigma factor [Pigmentiphaga sp. NML080357]OVZ57909.1 RNA polymerase subunit sigma-70 [Pigmentiphaga sp. NML080357]